MYLYILIFQLYKLVQFFIEYILSQNRIFKCGLLLHKVHKRDSNKTVDFLFSYIYI